MAKRIITISREFGSGGRFIGEEVAKKLGIADPAVLAATVKRWNSDLREKGIDE